MSDPMFYVEARRDNKVTGYVPAKFLIRNGSYITNPTPGGSQKNPLFSDGSGNNRIEGRAANPNNYLIVPEIYNEQQARDFARGLSETVREDPGGTAVPSVIAQMTDAFWPGGSQDLQRNPQWGIPKGSFVPAFIGSASNHLGYVTALAGIPMSWSELGGGIHNLYSRLRGYDVDTDGPYWLSKENHANIVQGFSDGTAAGNPPSPFTDYSYNTQPGAGARTGGNGVSDWASSVLGIDPDEPAPPAWPPQSNRPIRFLSSRRLP